MHYLGKLSSYKGKIYLQPYIHQTYPKFIKLVVLGRPTLT
jgi:hypothetical protein